MVFQCYLGGRGGMFMVGSVFLKKLLMEFLVVKKEVSMKY